MSEPAIALIAQTAGLPMSLTWLHWVRMLPRSLAGMRLGQDTTKGLAVPP
jgi:hypothetical protein